MSARVPLSLALLALRQSGYDLSPATLRSWIRRGHINRGPGGYCITEICAYLDQRESLDSPHRVAS